MGSQWVEDPSWGNIFSGFANDMAAAPGKALTTMAQADAIKRARELHELGAATANKLDAAVPQAYVAPTDFTAVGPMVGDVNNPADTAGIPRVDLQYTDPRAMAAAQARRDLAIAGGKASIMKDPDKWASQLGFGSVAAGGVPKSAEERAQLEYYTTGKFPTHIGRDESKNPIKNWAEIDASNQPTGKVVASPTAPGANYVLTGPASTTPNNPVENAATAQNNFNKLAVKALQTPLTPAEIEQASVLANSAWPTKTTTHADPQTGQLRPLTERDGLPTGGAPAYLLKLINDWNNKAHLAPQPPVAGGDQPAAPAPGAPPLPPPVLAQPGALTMGAPITGGNPGPVVQRYMHNPVVVSMENAKNGYSSLVGNMPFNNAASDLAIVIGAAKVLDPPSVVREGEVENVKKTGGIMDQFIGMIDKATGGAGLDENVRAQIWQMVNAKLEGDVKNMRGLREQGSVQLRQAGLEPETYLPALPQLFDVDRSIINKKDVRGSPAATPPPPAVVPRGADALVGGR